MLCCAVCRPVVNITPLVSSNFHELVLGQERGVRLIVLFVDDQRKMKLINHFAAAVKPFVRCVLDIVPLQRSRS